MAVYGFSFFLRNYTLEFKLIGFSTRHLLFELLEILILEIYQMSVFITAFVTVPERKLVIR